MPVVPDDIAGLLAGRPNGTLATLRKDGRPQLSVVTYAWYAHDPDREDGRAMVRISTVDGRAKVINLRRDPRASLLPGSAVGPVTDESGWSYAVVEGRVELSPVATVHDDETVEELIRLYRDASGEHPDWPDYRRAMVDDHRLVARLVVDHAYGLVRS
ncbi:MAG: PPOX class F420-dependent oxidoreductase [Lapillicoccus sp.]